MSKESLEKRFQTGRDKAASADVGAIVDALMSGQMTNEGDLAEAAGVMFEAGKVQGAQIVMRSLLLQKVAEVSMVGTQNNELAAVASAIGLDVPLAIGVKAAAKMEYGRDHGAMANVAKRRGESKQVLNQRAARGWLIIEGGLFSPVSRSEDGAVVDGIPYSSTGEW